MLGIWAEVRLWYDKEATEAVPHKSFRYTFDYVVAPLAPVELQQVAELTRITEGEARATLTRNGYTLSRRDGAYYVEDFPDGEPCIVEVMTSSTSGGNKKRRTTVPLAFEDALLGKPHTAPGINYRQVWARMVSQLIAKSEVALSWCGKTIWVVQDLLVDYISASTALDFGRFLSQCPSEVNVVSLSYGNLARSIQGIIELTNPTLYAGSVGRPTNTAVPTFQDIMRAPTYPPVSSLLSHLANRRIIRKVISP